MKIALIAHDKKKDEIIELSKKYKDVLGLHELYATGTTGTLIMGETGLSIKRMKSGPLGGDQQIGAMLAEGKLDLIVFLRDPLTAQPHEPDVSALLRLCDVQKIPLATNFSSATIMLEAIKIKFILTKCKLKNKLSHPFWVAFLFVKIAPLPMQAATLKGVFDKAEFGQFTRLFCGGAGGFFLYGKNVLRNPLGVYFYHGKGNGYVAFFCGKPLCRFAVALYFLGRNRGGGRTEFFARARFYFDKDERFALPRQNVNFPERGNEIACRNAITALF